MWNEFITTGPRRHKQLYCYDLCFQGRSLHAARRGDFGFFLLFFLKKRLIGLVKRAFLSLQISKFSRGEGGGACPQTPPASRAFGAPNLPRLVLKSGYGPGYLLCSALRYEIYKHIKQGCICRASISTSQRYGRRLSDY